MAIVDRNELQPRLAILRPDPEAITVQLAGVWRLGEPVPALTPVQHELAARRPVRLGFDTRQVERWDSVLVAFATRVMALADAADVASDRSGLPTGVQRLLALAEATPVHHQPAPPRPTWLARIGTRTLGRRDTVVEVFTWIGELAATFARLITGQARFRRSGLWLQMQLAGARGLGIISLVVGLVGLILAFVSAVQLEPFGGTIYVANLVGVAIVRELGAMITAIVVAGRTGAAFAAELGTMRVTQEIDAFATLGIRPVEFLVLPRILAVTLMMPLLCIYADGVGLLGGAVVGVGMMGVNPQIYLEQTLHAVSLSDLLGGLLKAMVYGLLVASAACWQGLRSGRTAAAVGAAATAAVVDGIVLVIAACAVFAVIFYELGI